MSSDLPAVIVIQITLPLLVVSLIFNAQNFKQFSLRLCVFARDLFSSRFIRVRRLK